MDSQIAAIIDAVRAETARPFEFERGKVYALRSRVRISQTNLSNLQQWTERIRKRLGIEFIILDPDFEVVVAESRERAV